MGIHGIRKFLLMDALIAMALAASIEGATTPEGLKFLEVSYTSGSVGNAKQMPALRDHIYLHLHLHLHQQILPPMRAPPPPPPWCPCRK